MRRAGNYTFTGRASPACAARAQLDVGTVESSWEPSWEPCSTLQLVEPKAYGNHGNHVFKPYTCGRAHSRARAGMQARARTRVRASRFYPSHDSHHSQVKNNQGLAVGTTGQSMVPMPFPRSQHSDQGGMSHDGARGVEAVGGGQGRAVYDVRWCDHQRTHDGGHGPATKLATSMIKGSTGACPHPYRFHGSFPSTLSLRAKTPPFASSFTTSDGTSFLQRLLTGGSFLNA
ncbi:MAG: hypothetical protein JWO70_2469 [Betaproteobacteria bacterium]|nr:hypothetical protein [Betaproteobacteria bacterium]